MRTALGNQLRAELERFWPGPIGLFSDLHSQISLAFLERYPSPTDTRGLGEARMAAFLRERVLRRPRPLHNCWPSSGVRPPVALASMNWPDFADNWS